MLERRAARRLGPRRAEEGPRRRHDATRKASNEAIQRAASLVPSLVGGSADLAPSTKTLIKAAPASRPASTKRRNLHFGIREHGMGAIVNGLALSRASARSAPRFLIFSDYMRPSVAWLARVVELQSIFVYTHDSIFLGEDGPTHQPIEQLAHVAARSRTSTSCAPPANETALAWRHALKQTNRPTAFALSRQGLPVWDPSGVPDDAIERGAYVLRDSEGGDPELILMGSRLGGSPGPRGDEAARGRRHPRPPREHAVPGPLRPSRTRPIVTACCRPRYGRASRWRPPARSARHRWVGDDGDVVAMEGFGASAPAKALYEHFGFSGQAIADRARAVLERTKA